MASATRYARNGDVNLAYQVHGQGPLDLLYVSAFISHVEYLWEDPGLARFFRRLAQFSRLILVDRRGTGMSDSGPLTPEDELEDLAVVLDAAGSERAAILSYTAGGPLAALFAARFPERVSSLVLYGSMLRATRDEELPWLPSSDERTAHFEDVLEHWGQGRQLDGLAPSAADDERLREWFARLERLAASPGQMRRLVAAAAEFDVRPELASVRVPTLVLHRRSDALMDGREARRAARRRLDAERRRRGRAARRDRGVPHRRTARRRAGAHAADRAVQRHRRQHGAGDRARGQALARPAGRPRHHGPADAGGL